MKDFNSVSRPQKENDVNKDIFNHCINLIGVCESENGARKQHSKTLVGSHCVDFFYSSLDEGRTGPSKSHDIKQALLNLTLRGRDEENQTSCSNPHRAPKCPESQFPG